MVLAFELNPYKRKLSPKITFDWKRKFDASLLTLLTGIFWDRFDLQVIILELANTSKLLVNMIKTMLNYLFMQSIENTRALISWKIRYFFIYKYLFQSCHQNMILNSGYQWIVATYKLYPLKQIRVTSIAIRFFESTWIGLIIRRDSTKSYWQTMNGCIEFALPMQNIANKGTEVLLHFQMEP